MAQYFLGVCYEFGLGVTKDPKSAFDWYSKSAKQDQSTVGKFALGTYYEHSIGIEKNEEMAIQLYIKAADNGHVIAQFNLGNFFSLGSYVQKDDKKAFHYFV